MRNVGRRLVEEYDGQVPDTMEDLLTLPGVARKTANVVLGNAFDVDDGIAVDTHVKRLSNRLALTEEQTPEKIERDLMALTPARRMDRRIAPADLARTASLPCTQAKLRRMRHPPSMPFRAIILLIAGLTLTPAWGCTRPVATPPPAPVHTATPTAQNAETPESPASPASPTPPQPISIVRTDTTFITKIEVERNDVDLPTYLHAVATELARDQRIAILAERIDGELRPDGVPVAVVTFQLAESDTVGSQFAVAHEDGLHFVVTTCLARSSAASLCDEAFLALHQAE